MMDCKRIQCYSSSSSSLSSSHMMWKYDVFVSFRGEDTRYNFTDHLFGALNVNGIHTFRDDTNLRKGESIAPELLQAIEESQVLIVVFSKNYASSTWCLQELAKIADCINVHGQRVLPIFFDVNPSDVRKQNGEYGRAFAEYEDRFKEDEEKIVEMQRWREALTRVANLSGWDVTHKPQYAEIEKIVKEVTSLIGYKFSNIPDDMVGMHSRVEELQKLLNLDSNDDIRVVGICGMGGVGKSTLATILYGRISNLFDACYYIDDVTKIYGDYSPIGAPKQLLSQTLNDKNLQIRNLFMGTNLIRNRLCQIKALIVVDNVNKTEQLEKMPFRREWLGAGSRIIIISRDHHILKEHAVDEVYKVQLLNNDNALQLLCRTAFRSVDIMGDYRHLVNEVLSYAEGLPLAIKVLGSLLCGRDVSEWESALARLEKYPAKDIMNVIRISFDVLEDDEKEIFLDIACFFDQCIEQRVMQILDIRGFHPAIGIRVLIDKSLITCELGIIHMHDLLKELGKSIVRENSPKEPRKWSRLWDYDDFHEVILENKAAENLEAVVVEKDSIEKQEITMRADALSTMNHLNLLKLRNVNFSGSLNYLSKELGYLSWDKYPFTSLPSSFEPAKLVKLFLPHSNIKQLWKGTKHLPYLRTLNLKYSKNLIQLPDFRAIPSLQKLNLKGCERIVQIDPSIGTLRQLSKLNLKNCKSLASIPNNIFGLNSLVELNLSGCFILFKHQLLKNPRQEKHLEKLYINNSNIQSKSTFSVFRLLKLPFRVFHSQRHEDSIGQLLPSLPHFPCLTDLNLSFCNLHQIPDAIACLRCLRSLNLGGNNFSTLPCSIKELSKLSILNLEHCKQLKYLPELLLGIEGKQEWEMAGLYIFNCPELSQIEHCYNAAFSCATRFFEVNMQTTLLSNGLQIVVPGSRIPGWFNKQSAADSITLDPSPIERDDSWIGISFCAAIVVHDDPTSLFDDEPDTDSGHISFEFSIEKSERGYVLDFPVHLIEDLVTTEFDHLLLLFLSHKNFGEVIQYIKEAHDFKDIKLELSFLESKGLSVEVKSFGYRWVFKEDFQQFDPEMMFGKKSASRKRKFLTND